MRDTTSASQSAPELVRAAREAKRLSREGLAFKAGVSLKTIERIERGDTFPHRSTQQVIASVLGVEVAAIFPEPEGQAA